MINLIQDISQLLNVSNDEIIRIVKHAQNSYKKFYIKKKNGSNRTIFQPSKSLKSVQYALINLYFNKLPVHNIVFSYKKGLKSPLRENAKKHLNYKFSLKIDFENFFPSIKFIDLKKTLKSNGLDFCENDFDLLQKIVFPAKHISQGLPIGAPVSPIISNIVMYNLDRKMVYFIKRLNGDNTITRYADDIVFSSNLKKNCTKFYNNLKSYLLDCNSPKLKINDSKTKYLKNGFRKAITGLIITPNLKISIGRKNKRYVKKLVHEYSKNIANEKIINKLKGYLAFILDVEPTFYDSLIMKYGNLVNDIRKN